VSHLHGDHLDWLRANAHLGLVVGRGPWEDSTGALESTQQLADRLAEKGIPHELDVWGEDAAHDWPAWQRQIAHHLGRLV
jgi:esterase/lipase superfamily enzyme